MERRRFLFWFGLGLFSLGEKTRIGALDTLAAATMRFGEPEEGSSSREPAEHWTAAENRTWAWYERETFTDGRWKLTGITTPINKETGESYAGHTGYLDASLVPAEMRPAAGDEDLAEGETDAGLNAPTSARRARHGRPPSKWLRSLIASEIRTWLKTIEVPQAGVSGMTYWTHLTRDHSFDPVKIAGLTMDEQAKLHAAAHYGY